MLLVFICSCTFRMANTPTLKCDDFKKKTHKMQEKNRYKERQKYWNSENESEKMRVLDNQQPCYESSDFMLISIEMNLISFSTKTCDLKTLHKTLKCTSWRKT